MNLIRALVLALVAVLYTDARTVKNPEMQQGIPVISNSSQGRPSRPNISTLPFNPNTLQRPGSKPAFTLQVEPIPKTIQDKLENKSGAELQALPKDQSNLRFLWNLFGNIFPNSTGTSNSGTAAGFPNFGLTSPFNIAG